MVDTHEEKKVTWAYEYQMWKYPLSENLDGLVAKLNVLGSEGWDIFSIFPTEVNHEPYMLMTGRRRYEL